MSEPNTGGQLSYASVNFEMTTTWSEAIS